MKILKVCLILATCLQLTGFTPLNAQDKLIFAIDIIRHGDRSPLHNLPNIPHQWPQGFGALSPVGMQQEYQLGQQFRNKYVTQYHLLPENFAIETLYVRSTDIDRTLMSAQSLLYGLYPLGSGPKLPNSAQFALPLGHQVIPIHTVPQEFDTLLNPTVKTPAYKNLIQQTVYSSAEWQNKTSAWQKKFLIWGKAVGVEIKHPAGLEAIADTLYVDQLNHVPMARNLPTPEVIAAGHWVFTARYKPRLVGKYTGGALLIAIKDYLENAIENKSPLKYVLFSAHDSTLLAQMSALGAPLSQIPHYASNLNYALFKTAQNTYYVEVSFNERPVNIPECGGSVCTMVQFNKILDVIAGLK